MLVMERNNESRDRYNDRNTSQSDQNSDWNQSSDFQQNRNQNAYKNESQWDSNRRNEDRDQQGNYGRNRYGNNRNERRLDSMGSLGNDTNRFDDDDSSNRGAYGQSGSRNYGGAYESGNYDRGQTRNYDYGNRRDYYDDRDRNRGGSSYNNRGNDSRNWWDKTKDEVSGWFGDENAQQRRNVDQMNDHRGKGPKGYTRTDERIKEDVHERLTEDGQIDASDIEVDVKSGEVFLKGTVKNRQEKRRAEDIIENISGVKNVENHIKLQQENITPGISGQNYGQQYGEKKFGTSAGSGINVGTELNKHN
jgi:osmotically-inducible protein OsmY